MILLREMCFFLTVAKFAQSKITPWFVSTLPAPYLHLSPSLVISLALSVLFTYSFSSSWLLRQSLRGSFIAARVRTMAGTGKSSSFAGLNALYYLRKVIQ